MPKLAARPARTTPRPPMTDESEATQLETPSVAEQIRDAEIPEVVEPNTGDVIPDETTPEAKGIVEPEHKEPEQKAPAKKAPARRKPAQPKSLGGSLFTPLSEVEDKLNILMWGREGTSKTTSLATLANRGRLLVINAEGGLKKAALKRQGINVDNIQVWPRPGEPITYDGLNEVWMQVKSDLDDDPDSWVGVGFDSATDIVQAMVDRVSNLRLGKVRDRGVTIDEVDQWTTDRNDFGVMSKQFRDILRKFRDLHCHVIVTALERRDVDEDTQKVSYGPAVSPALQTDLLGYVDIVLYTRAPDEDRDFFRASTKKAGAFRSKDRFGSLPPTLVNPTAERVLDYIEERLTADTDPEQAVVAEANAAIAARREAAAEAKEAAKKKAADARAARAANRKTATTKKEGDA